jgi:TP901 family phage tail tape measure protein
VADDLNVILKAQLDVNETSKEVNIQLGQIEEKIKSLGVKIDMDDAFNKINTSFNKVKESMTAIQNSFGNIDIGTKFSKGFDELSSRVSEIRSSVDSLAKVKISTSVGEDGTGKIESALLTYENKMGQIVTETMEWKNTFDDIGNITGQNFRTSFSNISEDITKANAQSEKFSEYIDKARMSIEALETKISNLSVTKGLDSSNYTSSITAMKEQLAILGQGGETSELIKQEQILNGMLLTTNNLVTADTKSLSIIKQKNDLYASIDAKITKLNSIQTEYTGADTTKIKEAISGLNTLKASIEDESVSIDAGKIKNKEFGNSMSEISTQAKKASAATSTWYSRFARVFQFTMFYRGISMVQEGITETINIVSDLDSALVSLQKVTNLSGSSLDDFTQKSYELGSQISKSGKSVIEAATAFAKAGYGEDELLSLSKASLVLTSIGDGITDSSEAATTLIAVMKGFGKGTGDVTTILDEINEVSNNSAVNFDDISSALQRMSGVMSTTGSSLEESIGMFTAINEVLQNAETSSTALNTISMRLRGLEEDGTALSEDNLIPKLNSMFKDMAGIDMTDATGQVKSLFKITKELAPVWDTLTTNEKSYIAQQAAGIRQSKAFLVLMNNYDETLKATDLAYNSAGSAMQEFSKWEDSIEGKTNNLQSALELLSTKTLNSDLIKAIIDTTTALVKFSTATGGAIPTILSLVSAFAVFKSAAVGEFLADVVNKMKELRTASKATTTATIVQTTATEAQAVATKEATVATTGLSLANKALISGGIILAILSIAYVVERIAGAADRAKESVNALSTELSDLQESSATIANLSKQFDSLKGLTEQQRVANGTQQEFLDIQNQLNELLPNVNGFYDAQGNFIVDTKEDAESLNTTLQKLITTQREQLNLASSKSMEYTIGDYESNSSRVDYLNKYLELAQKSESGTLESTDTPDRILFLQDYLGVSFDSASIKQAIYDAGEVVENSLTDMQSDLRIKLMASDKWDGLGEDVQNAILKSLSEVSDDNVVDFSESIDAGDLSINTLLNTLENTQAFTDYIQALKDAENATDGLEESSETLETTIESLSGTRSTIESLQDVLSNLNSGSFSASDMEDLLGISEEFIPYLNDEVALREKLTESISDYEDEYTTGYQNILDTSDTFYDEQIKGDETLYNNLRGNVSDFFNDLGVDYTDDFTNYKNLEDAKVDLTTKILAQLAGSWSDYFDAFTGQLKDTVDPRLGSGGTGGIFGSDTGFSSAYTQITSAQSELDKIFAQTYTPSLFSFDTTDSSSSSDSTEDAAQEQVDVIVAIYEKASKEISDKVTQIELKQQLTSSDTQLYYDLEKQKYDAIIDSETLLQEKIAELQALGTDEAKEQAEELIDTYYDTVEERYSIISDLQSSQIEIYEAQIESLESVQSAIEDLHEYTMDMIEEEMEAEKEAYEQEIEDIESVFDAKIDALSDEADETEYDDEVADMTENIADLESQIALISLDDTATADLADLEDELAEAQEELEDYQYDRSIELQQAALEDKEDALTDALQDEIDDIDDTLDDEVELSELADARIESSGEDLYDQLIAYSEEYGTITEEEITTAWENATTSIEGFTTEQDNLLTKLKEVAAELAIVQASLDSVESMELDDYSDSIGTSTSSSTYSDSAAIAQMAANSAAWSSASASEQTELAAENQEIGLAHGWYYDSSKGKWYYDSSEEVPLYHEGGVVGGDQYATKSTEELAKLLNGEMVITSDQAQNALDTVDNISDSSSSQNSVTNNLTITGNADSSTVESLQSSLDDLAELTIKKLATARSNTGFKSKISKL